AEFRTEFGDVLLLCSRIPLASVLKLKSGSRVTKYVEFLSVVELAATENCVTVAAHPYAVSREGCGRLFELRHLDCVEVHNSSSDIVTNFYTAYVANSKKCRIAGSDAHVPEMIGSAYTLVEIGKFDAESVVEGIRKSRVEPRYSAALDFLKSLSSIRSRTLHSLRARLSARRNHWERSCSYSI
ncbi:MAG: PHP-associated domain-containing protein, partial [Sulfolobales archaeon]|nr:PHP-associated domain-containing protein [Sulfolobales archaeon]